MRDLNEEPASRLDLACDVIGIAMMMSAVLDELGDEARERVVARLEKTKAALALVPSDWTEGRVTGVINVCLPYLRGSEKPERGPQDPG